MPLKALVIVIIILTVLMLLPLGFDGGYSGGRLTLGVRLGFLNIRLSPEMLKAPKLRKPKKTVIKEEPVTEKKRKEKVPMTRKELIRLAKIGLKALSRLRRKLRVDYIRIHYTFATGDPFTTAMGYGYSSAALSAVLPLLDEAFNIGERDINTSFDFLGEKPVFDCWLTMTIQVWEVLYVAAAFGIDYLKLKHKHKNEDRIRKE